MAQDARIESCNKKLREAAENVGKSHDRILNSQRPATMWLRKTVLRFFTG
jgi:hypothetical protein